MQNDRQVQQESKVAGVRQVSLHEKLMIAVAAGTMFFIFIKILFL